MQPKTQWYCIVGKSWYSGIHESAVFTKYVDQAPLTASERAQWKAEAEKKLCVLFITSIWFVHMVLCLFWKTIMLWILPVMNCNCLVAL